MSASPRVNWRVKYLALEASYEALSAENIGLQMQIDSLKQQRRDAVADDRVVSTRAVLMQRAKELAARGVACYVRGQHVFDSKTREIIR